MPWRKSGVKYSQNEIYLDIVEEMDAILDPAGMVGRPKASGRRQGGRQAEPQPPSSS